MKKLKKHKKMLDKNVRIEAKIVESYRVITTVGAAKWVDKGDYLEDQLGRRMPKDPNIHDLSGNG